MTEKLQERLAKLSVGIAVLNGANNATTGAVDDMDQYSKDMFNIINEV